jgi:hypothetical protein
MPSRNTLNPGSAGHSRRSFLKMGALGVGGLTLPELFRARAAAGQPVDPDTSVIFIWLPGGPPHLDMYDMKPEAPADYRGEFTPIPTNVPGLDVCEHMPLHARCADRYAVIRSISHTFADHGGGHKKFLTGRDPKTPTETVVDYPMVGSVVSKFREGRSIGLPNYISGTDPGRDGVDVFAFGAAYLGPAYTPFSIAGDPSQPNFSVQNISVDKSMSDRLDDRLTLRRGFDQLKRDIDSSGVMNSIDSFTAQAVGMLTSDKARTAFDLSLESEETRERYGKHAWGARALLARRLVEAGCSFVTMVMENPYQSGLEWLKNGTYNWDSHAVNCHIFDDTKFRLPLYDRAVTALIEDVYARGLDKKVMIIVTGEFGRTPRIEHSIGTHTGIMQPGRDHWPNSMSLIVSGGGLKTGQVIGSTTEKGEVPKDRPLAPSDLWATMYRHLGIDPSFSFPDYSGRPMPILSDGQPIAELI